MNKIDRVGVRYGRLTVISEAPKIGTAIAWICRCDCGDEGVVRSTNLGRRGIPCKCVYSRGNRIHGHSRFASRTYFAWHNAKTRCYDEDGNRYHRYGGRGIEMCDRWRDSFVAFLEDMGECPEGMTLERNDVNGNYEKSNCHWATKLEQARNKSTSLKVTAKDGSVKTIKEIADDRGMSYYTLRMASKRGEDPYTFIPRGW